MYIAFYESIVYDILTNFRICLDLNANDPMKDTEITGNDVQILAYNYHHEVILTARILFILFFSLTISPYIFRSRQVPLTASCVRTELMYVSLCWSANTGAPGCVCLTVSSMFCSLYLDGL